MSYSNPARDAAKGIFDFVPKFIGTMFVTLADVLVGWVSLLFVLSLTGSIISNFLVIFSIRAPSSQLASLATSDLMVFFAVVSTVVWVSMKVFIVDTGEWFIEGEDFEESPQFESELQEKVQQVVLSLLDTQYRAATILTGAYVGRLLVWNSQHTLYGLNFGFLQLLAPLPVIAIPIFEIWNDAHAEEPTTITFIAVALASFWTPFIMTITIFIYYTRRSKEMTREIFQSIASAFIEAVTTHHRNSDSLFSLLVKSQLNRRRPQN